jgi:hypothetical protein
MTLKQNSELSADVIVRCHAITLVMRYKWASNRRAKVCRTRSIVELITHIVL